MSEPVTTTDSQTPTVQDTQPVQSGVTATFTQADVDRLIGERLKRDRETSQTKFLTDLGVKDADSLKGIIEAHTKSEEAKKTEAEKWQTKYDALEKKFAAMLAENEGYKANEIKGKRHTAIKDALRDAKANDVDDLLIILEGKYTADVSAVLDDDGAVNKKAVDKLVTTAKTGHAKFFTAQIPGSQSNRNGKPAQTDKKVVLTKRLSF